MTAYERARKKCWDSFSLYVRMRDCIKTTGTKHMGRCVTCNNIVPFKGSHAGHFIQGRHNAVLISERGVNLQCARCNITLKGNVLEYRQVMVKRHGEEEVQNMEILAKVTKKIYKHEWNTMRLYYKQEHERMKK